MFSILHLLDCQGKSHFLFYFSLPFFFPFFPFLSTLFSHLPLFLFPLPHSHTILHHPLTGAPFLSFHFRRARIDPPYYHFIVLYYLSTIIAFFFTLKNIKKTTSKNRDLHTGRALFNSLFTRARYSPSLGRATLSSSQLSSAAQSTCQKISLERGWFLCSYHLHPSSLLLSSASIASARFHHIARLPLVWALSIYRWLLSFTSVARALLVKTLAINSFFFTSVTESIARFL